MHILTFRPIRRLKYLFQVLGDDAAIHIEKLADGFLRQSDSVILHPHLDAFFMGAFRKDEETHCTVADLRFIFWHCVSTPLVPNNLSPELQGRPLGRLPLYSEGVRPFVEVPPFVLSD